MTSETRARWSCTSRKNGAGVGGDPGTCPEANRFMGSFSGGTARRISAISRLRT